MCALERHVFSFIRAEEVTLWFYFSVPEFGDFRISFWMDHATSLSSTGPG